MKAMYSAACRDVWPSLPENSAHVDCWFDEPASLVLMKAVDPHAPPLTGSEGVPEIYKLTDAEVGPDAIANSSGLSAWMVEEGCRVHNDGSISRYRP